MAAHASLRIMPKDSPSSVRRSPSVRVKVSTASGGQRRPRQRSRGSHDPLERGPVIVRKPNVVQKALKAFLPHFGLTFLLLFYLAFGSWVFIQIESTNDETRIKGKMADLKSEYDKMLRRTRDACTAVPDKSDQSRAIFEQKMRELISGLEKVHVKHRAVDIDPKQLQDWDHEKDVQWKSRWNWATSILHTLGVLTTTGYSYVQLFSREGQLFAIFYGLIGFPLTFITAANIGKFLSEMVTFLHAQYSKRTSISSGNVQLDGTVISMAPRDSKGSLISSLSDDYFEMPAWAILGFTLAFCCVGAGMYMGFQREWDFITALYFAFNAVTNVTLGDLLVDNIWFSLFTVIYVIFGLAVVTMSIDLAQNQLRHLFQRVHYFGRKIQNFWYGHFRASQIDEDVKEVLRIMSNIRKEHPDKEHVTRIDILDYLNRKCGGRPPGAYSPDGISVLPFADDNVSNPDHYRLATIDSDTECEAVDMRDEKSRDDNIC